MIPGLVMRHRARAARLAKGRLRTWRDRPPGPGPSRRRGFNLQLAPAGVAAGSIMMAPSSLEGADHGVVVCY